MRSSGETILRARSCFRAGAQAEEWFGIFPKEDQFKDLGVWKRRKPGAK